MGDKLEIKLMYGELNSRCRNKQDIENFCHSHYCYDIFDKYNLIKFEYNKSIDYFLWEKNTLERIHDIDAYIGGQNGFEFNMLWDVKGYIGSKEEVCNLLNLVKNQFVPIVNNEEFDPLKSNEKMFGLIILFPSGWLSR